MNKLFLIAIIFVCCTTLLNDSTPSSSYTIAVANAFGGQNHVSLSSYGGANGIELGGYNLKCTGKKDKVSQYIGSIGIGNDNYISPKKKCKVSSSIGGIGYDGKGYQDYDYDEAG